jgi:hypothetical protein
MNIHSYRIQYYNHLFCLLITVYACLRFAFVISYNIWFLQELLFWAVLQAVTLKHQSLSAWIYPSARNFFSTKKFKISLFNMPRHRSTHLMQSLPAKYDKLNIEYFIQMTTSNSHYLGFLNHHKLKICLGTISVVLKNTTMTTFKTTV